MKNFLNVIKFIIFLQIVIIAGCGGGADADNSIEIIDFSPYSGQVTKSSASWYVINSTPPFGPRDHASIIKVNDRIHLMGGFYRGHSTYQDYWISDDSGISWQLIHGSPLPLRNDLIYPVL